MISLWLLAAVLDTKMAGSACKGVAQPKARLEDGQLVVEMPPFEVHSAADAKKPMRASCLATVTLAKVSGKRLVPTKLRYKLARDIDAGATGVVTGAVRFGGGGEVASAIARFDGVNGEPATFDLPLAPRILGPCGQDAALTLDLALAATSYFKARAKLQILEAATLAVEWQPCD